MLVSAVSSHTSNGYSFANNISYYNNRNNEPIGEASLNYYTPYFSVRGMSQTDGEQVFDSINQWKNFCQNKILGEKLDVIA